MMRLHKVLTIALLLTGCGTASTRRSSSITEITIERAASPCGDFGYTATLTSEGIVSYSGSDSAPMPGAWRSTIPIDDFRELAAFIERQGYFDFAESYGEPGTHFGPTKTSAVKGGVRKATTNYGYYKPAGPLRLQWIETAIDTVVRNRTDNWERRRY